MGPHVRHEVLGTGDELLAAVDDAVHVGDHAEPAHVRPFEGVPIRLARGTGRRVACGHRGRSPRLRCSLDARDALRCTSDADPSRMQRGKGDPA